MGDAKMGAPFLPSPTDYYRCAGSYPDTSGYNLRVLSCQRTLASRRLKLSIKCLRVKTKRVEIVFAKGWSFAVFGRGEDKPGRSLASDSANPTYETKPGHQGELGT